MEKESRHGSYLLVLLGLMFGSLILFIPLFFIFGIQNRPSSYIFIVLISLVFGWYCSKVIEDITHKDKKEILAGIIIPLPVVMFLSAFPVIHEAITKSVSINPIASSLIYFVLFNAPFVIYFLEHEKHKHLYVWYFTAPLFIFMLWLVMYLVSSFIMGGAMTELRTEIQTAPTDILPVVVFTEECIKHTAVREMSSSFITEYLPVCLGEYEAFISEGYDITRGSVRVTVEEGDLLTTIKVNMPLLIKKGSIEMEIEDFLVTMENKG